MNAQNKIFYLSMQLNKRNCSIYNKTLFSFCWNKTSNSRFTHKSSEHQKSHQQLRKNLQADQMIHSTADSAAVQFDWETAVWKWKKWTEIVNSFTCRFRNKKKVWKSLSQTVFYWFKSRRKVWKSLFWTISCWSLLHSETSMSSENSNQEK